MSVLVNKMDLVDYSREVFESVKSEYVTFLSRLGVEPQFVLPVSALDGGNVAMGAGGTMMFGVPTIGFGPSDEIWAHSPDDQCPVEHLTLAARFYAAFPRLYLETMT